MALTNRVREFRMKAVLTQKELAEKLGIAQSELCRIEKGRYTPGLGLALRIAQAIGTPVDTLFLASDSTNQWNSGSHSTGECNDQTLVAEAS